MSRIFVPSSGPHSWQTLLADPVKHWARGFSARTLAHSWEDQDGFPPEVQALLFQHPSLVKAEPLLIFPEWMEGPVTRWLPSFTERRMDSCQE